MFQGVSVAAKKDRGMKKQILPALFSLLCLISFIPSTNIHGQPLTLKVGLYENQPKIFTDTSGNASGFWADIIDYIAGREGWNVEYIPGTWDECLQRLAAGEIDIMPDVAYTPARNKMYAFSAQSVYTSWSTVYIREGGGIESLIDLEGKTVAVLKNSVNVEGENGIKALVSAFDINCTFLEVDSYLRVFELVGNGQADAGVTSKDFGYQHESDFGLTKTAIMFQPSLLYFTFPKNSPLAAGLAEIIDAHMQELKENDSSIYYQSLDRWFGQAPGRNIIPAWMFWALGSVAALILLSAGGNFLLRSQVSARTRELSAEINRRKHADEELAIYHEQLEQLVEMRTVELKERTGELEQANLHLQEMDRLKSVFLASMSHELRTPLNSIIGFTGILLMGMPGELNDEQKKQLTMVKNNAGHLLSLINDILDISKIEAGKAEINPEEFRFDTVTSEVIEQLRPAADKKRLEIVADIPEDIILTSDKRRLKQILLNLVSNAVKFTEKGSVKITGRIAGKNMLEVEIADTGIGIKPEEMSKLFQPFQQVGASLTKKYEGTGLGLYLSGKLVVLLGGTISAGSEYGHGTEITIALPLNREEEKTE